MSAAQPIGRVPTGRLAGTMLRVLAAELSDPARFARAKEYARDGAVFDVDITPGTVGASVRGTRDEPYDVELHVRPAGRHELEAVVPGTATGSELLTPERGELATWCTCPDDARACKHAIAALLVLADEVTVDPAVLVRWRSAGGALAPEEPGPSGPDPLAHLLRAAGPFPATADLVPLGDVALPHDQQPLADAIRSAVAVLRNG